MRLDAFDYDLPAELIAQRPLDDRTGSRLLVSDRRSGERWHHHFHELPQLLRDGDLLVVNRSRVVPARLLLRRDGGGRAELLVTRVIDERRFLAIGQPLKKMTAGTRLRDDSGAFEFRVIERASSREVLVETSSAPPATALDEIGHVPLPPYIQRGDSREDRERYQTVYARERGSAAAPTAGLHFDQALLDALAQRGIALASVVLHVGPGTFLPLALDVVEENVLHAERYSVDAGEFDKITAARADGRRVIAVGTTAARVLETVWSEPHDPLLAGETDLFIYPGYQFKALDGLITNFHLPRSSLLLLVSALLGVENTLACYRTAVDDKYRFFSYGDAMFIR